MKRRHPAYAVMVCLLLMLLGNHWLYFTPTAKISVDINPSIELSINRLDRVIAVNSFNKEGWEILSTLDVNHKNYAEGVKQILDYEGITALLSGDEIMATTAVGSDRRQSAEILSSIETCTAGQSNTYCYCYFARSEDVAAAHETGLSCGKYRAFLELQLLDPDITPETVQGITMREILELIESFQLTAKIIPSHTTAGKMDIMDKVMVMGADGETEEQNSESSENNKAAPLHAQLEHIGPNAAPPIALKMFSYLTAPLW